MSLHWRHRDHHEWTARAGAILLTVTYGDVEGWCWSMVPATGAVESGGAESLQDGQDKADLAMTMRYYRRPAGGAA